MIVTAVKNTNIRISKASLSADCAGYIPINGTLEVKDIIAGDIIDGNGIWYQSISGQYLWTGGFAPTKEVLTQNGQQMTWPGPTLAKIYESALHELTPTFFFDIAECNGVGVGQKNNSPDSISLIVYVVQKTNTPELGMIPQTVNYRGVVLNVDVRETGKINANAQVYQEFSTPINAGGGSVAEAPETAFGTRSALVYADGKPFILTCYHVACNALLTKKKVTTFDNGTSLIHIPAVRSGSTVSQTGKVTEGILDSTNDYALISITETSWLTPSVVEIGEYDEFYAIDEITRNNLNGLDVCFFGAKTQKKIDCSVVDYISNAIGINYDNYGKMSISGLITLSTSCLPGDSGAPVLDQNNKLLGYIIASGNHICYVMPFAYLNFYKYISLKK